MLFINESSKELEDVSKKKITSYILKFIPIILFRFPILFLSVLSLIISRISWLIHSLFSLDLKLRIYSDFFIAWTIRFVNSRNHEIFLVSSTLFNGKKILSFSLSKIVNYQFIPDFYLTWALNISSWQFGENSCLNSFSDWFAQKIMINN